MLQFLFYFRIFPGHVLFRDRGLHLLPYITEASRCHRSETSNTK